MYKDVIEKVNKIAKSTEMDEKETNQITGEIEISKAEIEKLKKKILIK